MAIRTITLPSQIQQAIDSGDYFIPEDVQFHFEDTGRWTDLSVNDAFAIGFLGWTEQGRHSHDKELARLEEKIDGLADPESFNYPELYCSRERVQKSIDYYQAKVDRMRGWLNGGPAKPSTADTP